MIPGFVSGFSIVEGAMLSVNADAVVSGAQRSITTGFTSLALMLLGAVGFDVTAAVSGCAALYAGVL